MEKDEELLCSGLGRPVPTLPWQAPGPWRTLRQAGEPRGTGKLVAEFSPRHLWVTPILWKTCLQHPILLQDTWALGLPGLASEPPASPSVSRRSRSRYRQHSPALSAGP